MIYPGLMVVLSCYPVMGIVMIVLRYFSGFNRPSFHWVLFKFCCSIFQFVLKNFQMVSNGLRWLLLSHGEKEEKNIVVN